MTLDPLSIGPASYDAVLFDLDGVLTPTAALHARCWKQALDPVLAEQTRRTGRHQAPFDAHGEYLHHVDGKPREDGVRDLLRARGILASAETVRAIADHKQRLVEVALGEGGIDPFPGSVRWVRELRAAGVRTAVVSSSVNCTAVLRAAGILGLFELTVDGGDVARLGLRGKPAPDGFLEAARRLGVAPRRAVVVEDALAGVAAGHAGAFGLVIGVARTAAHAELRAAGADVVVDDLDQLAA
jgi:alpha,alpha-trehalose phosphorylase